MQEALESMLQYPVPDDVFVQWVSMGTRAANAHSYKTDKLEGQEGLDYFLPAKPSSALQLMTRRVGGTAMYHPLHE